MARLEKLEDRNYPHVSSCSDISPEYFEPDSAIDEDCHLDDSSLQHNATSEPTVFYAPEEAEIVCVDNSFLVIFNKKVIKPSELKIQNVMSKPWSFTLNKKVSSPALQALVEASLRTTKFQRRQTLCLCSRTGG